MKFKDIIWFIFGGHSVQRFLWFLLGFFLVFGPAFAYCGEITELYIEKYSGIIIAYTEDGIFHFKESFVQLPRNVMIEKCSIPDKSEKYREIVGVQVIEL